MGLDQALIGNPLGTGSRPTGGMVLLVEDEESVGSLVRTYLDRNGFRVCWVRTGEEALVEFTRHPIRIVVLDIGLPGMDGYEVARRCREDEGLRRIMLVAMTGYGKDEDRRRSQEAGFNAHLVKPVDLEDLRMILNQPDPSAADR